MLIFFCVSSQVISMYLPGFYPVPTICSVSLGRLARKHGYFAGGVWWLSLKNTLEIHGRAGFQFFLLSPGLQGEVTASQYPERRRHEVVLSGGCGEDYLTQSGCSININWIDDSINKWMSDGKEVAADVPRQRWCSAVWREEGGGIRTWLRRFLAHVQLSTLDSASGQIFNHCQEMEAQAQSSNDWREKRNSNKWPKYI